MQGAAGCGFPVEGATRSVDAKAGKKAIAGLVFQTAELQSGFAVGVASEQAARVDATLRDGTSSSTTIYRAPSELQTKAKLFVSAFR